MDLVVSTLFGALCLLLILRLLRQRDIVDFQLGVTAAFAIGYFCLPVWFQGKSGLGRYPADQVGVAVLIFLVFVLLVVVGTWFGRRLIRPSIAFATPHLDDILGRWRGRLAIAAFAWYVYYFTTQDLTSYSSADREQLLQGGGVSAVTAAIADLALPWIAISTALALRDTRRPQGFVSLCMPTVKYEILWLVSAPFAARAPRAVKVAIESSRHCTMSAQIAPSTP